MPHARKDFEFTDHFGNIMKGKLILLHFNEIDSAKEMRYALLENEKVKKKHLSLKSMGH